MSTLSLDDLLTPLSSDEPHGSDCGYTFSYQKMSAMADYLGARAEQDELDRMSRVDFDGENAESDRRNAESFAEDGRRRLDSLAQTVKELSGRTATTENVRDEILQIGRDLLTQTGKDWRVAQGLSLAWLSERGLDGLQDGLQLAQQLLSQFGEGLHPQPDEDDPSDVSARAMVLSEWLAGDNTLSIWRDIDLLPPGPAGRLTPRDIDVMDGQAVDDRSGGARSAEQLRAIARFAASRQDGVSPDSLDEARVNAELERVAAQMDAIHELSRDLTAQFEAGLVRGDRLQAALRRCAQQLRGAQGGAAAITAAGDASAASFPAHASSGAVAAGVPVQGALQTRDDARRLILDVCKFLERTEPSHPAPYFLRRAERLLSAKDFFAIMRDMAPDALNELERITGHREETE